MRGSSGKSKRENGGEGGLGGVGWGGGLMCPSWGEAGQKRLSVELN